MTNRTLITLVTAALLALLAVAVGPALAGTYAVDNSHDLDANESIAQFQNDGYVASDVRGLDLQLSIAEKEDDVGIDTPRGDFETTYLCADYRETIPRTVRFYVPSDYWYPHPVEGQASVTDGTTMDMRPGGDGAYSSIKMEFDGRTRACFEVKKQASVYFNVRDWTNDAVENQTGFSLPSVSGNAEQWDYVPPKAFDEHDGTVGLEKTNGSLTLQYDASSDPDDERWVSVPTCGGAMDRDAAVCKHEEGESKVLLISQTSGDVNVRFKHGTDYSATGWAGLEDVGATIQRTIESIRSKLGGLFD